MREFRALQLSAQDGWRDGTDPCISFNRMGHTGCMSSYVSDVIWKYWIYLWKKEMNKFLTSGGHLSQKKYRITLEEDSLGRPKDVYSLCILCLCVHLFFLRISTESMRGHLPIPLQKKCSIFRYIMYMCSHNFSLISIFTLP